MELPASSRGLDGNFTFGSNERILDYRTFGDCKRISRTHPHAIKCLEAIWNRLFKYDIEILADGKQIKLKEETNDHIARNFKPFCKEFMLCYYELGIVPISIATRANGERVPMVMKDMGIITVSLDGKKNRGKVFTFYKTTSVRGNSMATMPKKDDKTYICSGYGYDPDYDGSLKSPLASVIPWVAFNYKMLSCAFRAEERNSQPEIFTEVPETQVNGGDRAMGTNIDMNLWHGDRFRGREDMRTDKILLNRDQFEGAKELNQLYIEEWNRSIGGGSMTMSGFDAPRRPMPMRINTLPVGQRVANVPRPIVRSDILEINNREEDIISGIFGVPSSLFNSDSRTYGGAQINAEMLSESLMAWRQRLSEVMTLMFKCIYTEELCDLYELKISKRKEEVAGKKKRIADIKKADANDALADIIQEVVGQTSVQVRLSLVPYDNSTEIWNQYLRGALSFEEFTKFSRMASGLPAPTSDNAVIPPWEIGLVPVPPEIKERQQSLMTSQQHLSDARGKTKRDMKSNKGEAEESSESGSDDSESEKGEVKSAEKRTQRRSKKRGRESKKVKT